MLQGGSGSDEKSFGSGRPKVVSVSSSLIKSAQNVYIKREKWTDVYNVHCTIFAYKSRHNSRIEAPRRRKTSVSYYERLGNKYIV